MSHGIRYQEGSQNSYESTKNEANEQNSSQEFCTPVKYL